MIEDTTDDDHMRSFLGITPLKFILAVCFAPCHLAGAQQASTVQDARLTGQPIVARVEMKLVSDEKVLNVIEKGDLLTVIEERPDDYVIVTHDGTKGAVPKVNASRVIESVPIYTELISEFPDEGRFHTLRASAWWARGEVASALQDFDQAIKLGYETPHAFSSRGLFHAANGDASLALADFETAIELDPEDVSLLINRAAIHLSIGNVELALADYDAAIAKDPDNQNVLHQRAIAYKSSGQFEAASNDFTRLIEIDSSDYRAIMGRGFLAFQQENHGDAVQDFGRAIELNPDDAIAWNNRGYNRFQLDQFEGAIADYRQAVKLEPTYGLALQNLAWALATCSDESLREPEEAIRVAEAACKLSNYDSVADLSALAAACAAAGKFERAVGWQEKVVAMVDEQYKDFATATLRRYEQKQPFASKSGK